MEKIPQSWIDQFPTTISLNRSEAQAALDAFERVANRIAPDRKFTLMVSGHPWWPKPGSFRPSAHEAINYLSRAPHHYLSYVQGLFQTYNRAIERNQLLEAEDVVDSIPGVEAILWDYLNTVALYAPGQGPVASPLDVQPPHDMQIGSAHTDPEQEDPEPNTSASMTTENRVIVPEEDE